MIDSRDPAKSCGINIVGFAQILTGELSRKWNGRVHAKYLSDAALADPRVGPVFASWDDVTIQIIPTSMFTIPDALGSVTLHPFGDFLMHDVGTGDWDLAGYPGSTKGIESFRRCRDLETGFRRQSE